MATAELTPELVAEDGLIVDLVVSPQETAEVAARPLDARRVNAVARFLRLLDNSPAAEPPADLVESTLARIRAAE